MEFLAFVIPFIVAIFLFWKYRKETVWWEYIVLIVPSTLIAILIKFCMVSYEVSSTEYLGSYVNKITHYDDWDEWIVKRCTRQVACGRTPKGRTIYRSESYDCSYKQNHDDEWYMTDNSNNDIEIGKDEFHRIKNIWKTPEVFLDMNRHYYTKDGDAQYYTWDNNENTIRTLTKTHKYENKVKVSKSVFNFESISEKEAKELNLFDYPEIKNYDQNPVLGYKRNNSLDTKKVQYINGMYGKTNQFRLYMICFYNQNMDIAFKQKSYWVGGNKNEFVVCVGLDSLTNKVLWSKAFSWEDKPTLETYTEQYFVGEEYFNISKYCDWLKPRIASQWKRKNFEDFDYLKVELSSTQYTWIFILTLLYNIGISIFVIKNDFKND